MKKTLTGHSIYSKPLVRKKIRNFKWISLLMLLSINLSCENRERSQNFVSISPKVEQYKNKSKPPKLEKKSSIIFRNKILNIGSCQIDTIITFKYFFKNNSQRKILIKKIIGSCGCLKLNYKKENIFPHEESSIEVLFSSGSDVGYYKKDIYVYFEKNEVVTLSFFVRVI